MHRLTNTIIVTDGAEPRVNCKAGPLSAPDISPIEPHIGVMIIIEGDKLRTNRKLHENNLRNKIHPIALSSLR